MRLNACRPYILWLFLALLTSPAQGEYRVHVLEIRNVDTGATRVVQSTLDHYQYPEFYPLSSRELVVLIDHWKCYGRTFGHQPHCERPEAQTDVQTEAPTADEGTIIDGQPLDRAS